MSRIWFPVLVVLALVAITGPAHASGHGPVFGLATPTLPQGGWSLDLAYMARVGRDATGSMQRTMLAYGLTEDVQFSLSVPALVRMNPDLMPARFTGLMPATRDFEVIAAFRFHREGVRVGTRRETTVFLGADFPTTTRLGAIDTAPGGFAAVAHGMASRMHYVWLGAGYRWQGTADGDRLGDVLFYSLVWGYRPPRWQREHPAPDWRLFLEAVGEVTGRTTEDGAPVAGTGGHTLFVGPTTLGIYGDWAVSGGVLFPVTQDLRGEQEPERLRIGINFARFF